MYKKEHICLTHDLARKILKVSTENLSNVGLSWTFLLYFDVVSSHIALRNCCGLDNKEESCLEKDKNVGEKRTPETNCYLTPMRPRQNIQYRHRAAENVRKWKGYDRRAAALMAHPSSRLFSCNKVIVHRKAWNGWCISSSKSKEIKCNKQHLFVGHEVVCWPRSRFWFL